MWGRKIDEFNTTKGNKLSESNQIWCNMSCENDYITLGTAEILENDTLDENYVESDEDENGVFSEYENVTLAYDCQGVCNDAIYSEPLNDWFSVRIPY